MKFIWGRQSPDRSGLPSAVRGAGPLRREAVCGACAAAGEDAKDRTAATCIWEADSVEAVRDYIDRTQGGSSENTYFEVDSEASVGLPEPATAHA